MKPKASSRQDLVAAIRQWLPTQFFAQWPLRRGLLWTPQRLVWLALLMAWSSEQTLGERFEAACDLLGSLFPGWKLGGTYTEIDAGHYPMLSHPDEIVGYLLALV